MIPFARVSYDTRPSSYPLAVHKTPTTYPLGGHKKGLAWQLNRRDDESRKAAERRKETTQKIIIKITKHKNSTKQATRNQENGDDSKQKSREQSERERAKVFGHGVKRTQAMKIWRLWGRYLNHQWHADLCGVFCVCVCVPDEAARKPKGKPLIFLRCCVEWRDSP